jgi:glucuronate isomerase
MTSGQPLELAEDRFFGPDERQKEVALHLYQKVAGLPIVSPHGHVDPRLFTDPDYSFGSPVDLLIIPDHYVFRMLHSQGIQLDTLGVPRRDGGPVESDHRKIWQIFADNFYLFRGTPSGVWLSTEFYTIFDIREKLNGANAQSIYDQIAEKLESPEFRPRKLFERFQIEVLCTTDAASDPLNYHATIRDSGWNARILPTFRPDAVVNLETENWRGHLDSLSEATGSEITSYKTFVQALENRRAFFKRMGAKATDHAALVPFTQELSPVEAETIFERALRGETSTSDAARFMGHMLMEMARMSIDDGLVMQLHSGSFRNHNQMLYRQYGLDKGADIPVAVEFTRNLHALLNKYGTDPRLSLILFSLDETPYARELAPLIGHYPAVKLGPPWWFHDSLNGIARYFDQVIETAGIYNTTGFNDDTRAFASIPARHDLWRRASANWVAGQVVRKVVDMDDAEEMIVDLAYRLAKKAYKLD